MRVLGALCAAAVCGVMIGERLGPSPERVAFFAGLGLLAFALVLGGRIRVVVAVIAVSLLGVACMQRALDGRVHSPLAEPAADRADARARLTLTQDPVPGPYSVRVLARVDRFDTGDDRGARSGGSRTVVVHATGDVAMRIAVLSSGERLLVDGWFAPLSGYDARLAWQHAVARLQVGSVLAVAPPASSASRLANWLRDGVLRGTRVLPHTEAALLGGFLLGDTRQVPRRMLVDFREAGLSHLLAVSGANVAFALALVGPVLRRLRLGWRCGAGVGVILLFGVMTRWEPSVLRASVMAALALFAVWAGRPADGLRVVTLAALILVVADPFLVHSVGFLLSLGASAGIVLWSRPWSRRLRGPAWLREALAVTLAAQVGVLPVLLPVFGSVPLVSVPANLAAVPVAEPLSIWGIVAGAVGGLAGPGGARLLQAPSLWMLRWIEWVAHTAAGVGVALDGRALWGVVAITAVAAAGRRYRRRPPANVAA